MSSMNAGRRARSERSTEEGRVTERSKPRPSDFSSTRGAPSLKRAFVSARSSGEIVARLRAPMFSQVVVRGPRDPAVFGSAPPDGESSHLGGAFKKGAKLDPRGILMI